MKIIEQGFDILSLPDHPEKMIEIAGRTCYKSEDKITNDSADKFVKMLRDRGHHAMLEFDFMIVKFITNRGVTHELVRHRLCSFAQESTRYVNYGGSDIAFIKPVWSGIKQGSYSASATARKDEAETIFMWSCYNAEQHYKKLLNAGWRPEQAREVLPNALKTEIVVGANMREWRHIFKLRCSPKAHPQMRALMNPLLVEMQLHSPSLFEDIES